MEPKNLKTLRQQKGLTQSEVAQKVGITETGYQNYERGRREPKISIALKIARVLGTTTEKLWGYSAKGAFQ